MSYAPTKGFNERTPAAASTIQHLHFYYPNAARYGGVNLHSFNLLIHILTHDAAERKLPRHNS